MESSHFNHSILKAFAVLECFTPDKPSWGVRELAEQMGTNKSTTHRLMATLTSLGALKKDEETDRYSLGLKLFELGARVDVQKSFIDRTHPVLERVGAEITETVHLGIWQTDKVLMVDRVESPQGLKLNSSIGRTSPAHCTSLGKVLLSYLAETDLDDFLNEREFPNYTEHTISTPEALKSECRKIRQQGYALDREEKEYGLICLGVPVFNGANQIVAALSAAGPAQRFKADMLSHYVNILQSGARSIRDQIGSFHPNP
ncbi:MAG: IclR family transcriptional regulator [Bacteroidota bacterium]